MATQPPNYNHMIKPRRTYFVYNYMYLSFPFYKIHLLYLSDIKRGLTSTFFNCHKLGPEITLACVLVRTEQSTCLFRTQKLVTRRFDLDKFHCITTFLSKKLRTTLVTLLVSSNFSYKSII
jgi:hypothetical protein